MSVAGLGRLGSCVLALLLLQTGDQAGGFRYQRTLSGFGGGAACAVLDAAVFSHAAGSLKDVRLFHSGREIPYAIAVNESAQAGNESAAVMNVRESAAGTEFDLAMPPRAYTQVLLRLEGKDFVARGNVFGMNAASAAERVPLGSFAVFDLSSKRLGRQTTVSLQESKFRFLHVVLRGAGFRVRGAEVAPNREGQTLFTTVAETRNLTQQDGKTVARFRVPAHVPVEQVGVTLAPGFKGNFSRAVRITASADALGSLKENVTGTILRVKTEAIHAEENTVAASLGSNLQTDATVKVAIDNDGMPALPLRVVALAMRQRTICFDAAEPVAMRYGDPALGSPIYEYQPRAGWKRATLGPEVLSPSVQRQKETPERRLHLRFFSWLGLMVLLAAAGIFTVRRPGCEPRR